MEVKLPQVFSNMLIDIAFAYYLKALTDEGYTEKQAVEKFMAKYVTPEDLTPDTILDTFVFLKQLLKQQQL